jgi:hypothetical protein
MQLRGSAKDKSGWSVRVSGVMVRAGCVGCQDPVGTTGTEGERGGGCRMGSRSECVSGCSQHWFASVCQSVQPDLAPEGARVTPKDVGGWSGCSGAYRGCMPERMYSPVVHPA